MKLLLSGLFILLAAACQAQTIQVMDFVKIKDGKYAEALYYYENNWKLYRDMALTKGYISSYRIEKTVADSTAPFDLILITEYPDKKSQEKSEENFRDILTTARPNGPILLNAVKPDEFRKSMFVKITETVWGK